MFKWPTLLRRKSTNSDPDRGRIDSGSSKVVETTLSPPRRWTVGRRLAFAVENGVIQMVAARHIAGRLDILDISRVSLLSDTESAVRRSDHLSLTVADYVSRFGGGSAEIDLVISGRETAFRSFLMPVLKPGALASAIGFEAQKQIPFPPTECHTDYQRTFKIIDKQRARYKIGLHAATSKLVKEELEPLRQKGLSVANVIIADQAVGYLLGRLPDYEPNAVYTLVEVGQSDCKVAYYRGSALEFTHTGSVSLTQIGSQPDITRIEFFAESLAREISVSQDYYSGQYAKALPNRILLCGELADQADLVELFNGKTQFEFVPFPIGATGLLKGVASDQCRLAVTCLPTLAAAASQHRLCNLLPAEIRQEKSRRTVGRYARLALALAAVAILTNWAHLRMSINSNIKSTEAMEQQVTQASQSEAYLTHRSLMQQIAFERAYIKKTEAPPGGFYLTLKELSILTPAAVKLYRLEYAPGNADNLQNLVLHGNVAASEIPPEMILAQYVERLKASGFYHNVGLVRHVKRKVRDAFVIDFQIEMQGVA
ncbi:MAG: hypothetical protein OEV49_13240 [candidate division Zixibacteria bacterium]|nr:hypothetical protein [candidate division Zixibacteria bacterium]MDH3937766.1 hypothetical protein [candidate division Zixibacteria bacterium]MDH4033996.1 hypothetical protein [candidate division Zixibacteria bacterium]